MAPQATRSGTTVPGHGCQNPLARWRPRTRPNPYPRRKQDRVSANNKVTSGESYPRAPLQGTSSQRLALEQAPDSTNTFEGVHDKETLITLRPPPQGGTPLGKEDQLWRARAKTWGQGPDTNNGRVLHPARATSRPPVKVLWDHGPQTPMSEPSSKMTPKNKTEPLSEAQQERGSTNNKVTSGKSYPGAPLQKTDTSAQVPTKPGMMCRMCRTMDRHHEIRRIATPPLELISSQKVAQERTPASVRTSTDTYDKETLITLRPQPIMAFEGQGRGRGAKVLKRTTDEGSPKNVPVIVIRTQWNF